MHNDIRNICKRCICSGCSSKSVPLLYGTGSCPFGVDNIVTLYLFSNQVVSNLRLSRCDIEVEDVDDLVLHFTLPGTRNTGNRYVKHFSVNADYVVGIGLSPDQ